MMDGRDHGEGIVGPRPETAAGGPVSSPELAGFEKGWRVALGHIRREGLEFFTHAEQQLSAHLAAEAAEIDQPTRRDH